MDDSLIEKRAKKAVYMREYTRRNKEKINEQRHVRFHANPENILARQREYNKREDVRKRTKAYNKNYNALHPEKLKAQRTEYRQANRLTTRKKNSELYRVDIEKSREASRVRYYVDKQKVIDRNRRWRQANPEKILAKNQRRRALKYGSLVENVDPIFIYERDKGICQLCGNVVSREEMTIDHGIPLSRGGEHSEKNIQLAHRSCNSSKGTKTMEEFRSRVKLA